ncbi:MAG: hypothetical protein ACR2MT_11740 [Aurantibacter sp.]
MRCTAILILIFIGLISCDQEPTSPLDSSFYPDQLHFGTHHVGFKTLWKYDITRAAVPYSDWNGNLYPTKETAGRQFQINIWYPTEDKNGEGYVSMKDYLNLSYRQVDFAESDKSRAFGQKEFISKVNDLHGSGSLTADVLTKLEPIGCRAIQNAKPLKGPFPVIIYPNGIAPVSNSATSEYLASHGFVVISFAPKGENGSTIDNSTKGAEVASDDIGFVLSQILELPFVDRENIGLMGNAIESSFCIAYQSKNRNIDAYVSLEGGFISSFEQSILNDLPFYEPTSIDIPLLLIYSPHSSIDPVHIEHLIYSRRYFAHLPGMREFEYLNFGLFNNIVPNIIGQPRGDIERGYTAAHELLKDYFNTLLKNNGESFDQMLARSKNAIIDTTFIWDEIPNLPRMAGIKNGYIKQGLRYIDSLYTHQKQYASTPFSRQFITDFTDWVAWKKDPEYSTRKWLMEKAIEDYPASALYSYDMAYYTLKAGDTLQAKVQYEMALEKLKTDTDQKLTPSLRTTISKRSIDQLKKIK